MTKAIICILLITALGYIAVFFAFRASTPQPDTVLINDALMIIQQGQGEDAADAVVFLEMRLADAFEDMDAARKSRDNALQIFMYILITMLSAAGISLYLYCERKILTPFRKLQAFAQRVAAGNFDMPLEMDKSNQFGAFTESFDLMREELDKAKESERKANQSKKELVASLSHDIKTPIASIKAVTELMLVKTSDEKEQARLHTITAKAEQINSLITNMFHATLEELQVLTVTPVEVESTEIASRITNADYNKQVMPFALPNCLVMADLLRLQQVFDNVVSNSYKYANTRIAINAYFQDQHLVIDIQDFGAGVTEEDLPLIFNKFYRGKNTENVSGQGLGLHISKYFMEQMQGDLQGENRPDGFAMKVMVKLAV